MAKVSKWIDCGDFLRSPIQEIADVYQQRTGHAMHSLDNVRIDQGRPDEAFNLHLYAVKLWKATYGDHHKL